MTRSPSQPARWGEIRVRSDVATVGDRKDPAATASALLRDGWIRTGDLPWADAEGYLDDVGRRVCPLSIPGE